MKKFYFLLTKFLIGLFVLTACSRSTPEQVRYTIEMNEYSFIPSTIEARVGQEVILEFINKGKLSHEVMFGQEVVKVNQRPRGYKTDMFKTGGIKPQVTYLRGKPPSLSEEHEEHSGFMLVLSQIDDSAMIKFIVTKNMIGEWEMGCFEQDGVHYDAGMKGIFLVNP